LIASFDFPVPKPNTRFTHKNQGINPSSKPFLH